VPNSLSRFDPFGNFRTPPTGSNPTITNHGYTGHRHNNTGNDNLGLIYMNARYYLPEVGRFISPDTIVPEPGNPQSYNR
jgi:RHS repeat-associated protein